MRIMYCILFSTDCQHTFSAATLDEQKMLWQAIQQRPTTEELDHRLTSLLEGMQVQGGQEGLPGITHDRRTHTHTSIYLHK